MAEAQESEPRESMGMTSYGLIFSVYIYQNAEIIYKQVELGVTEYSSLGFSQLELGLRSFNHNLQLQTREPQITALSHPQLGAVYKKVPACMPNYISFE